MNNISVNNNKSNNYSATRNGAICGALAGVADVYITSVYNKKQGRKIIDEFKKASFNEKRESLKALKNAGITTEKFREKLQGIFKPVKAKTVVQRALIYGGILGTVGLLLDTKHKLKNKETK